jgi:hypothetical protein
MTSVSNSAEGVVIRCLLTKKGFISVTLLSVALFGVGFKITIATKKERNILIIGMISELVEATWQTFVLLMGDPFKIFLEDIEPVEFLFFVKVYWSKFVAPACKMLSGFVFRKEIHIGFQTVVILCNYNDNNKQLR